MFASRINYQMKPYVSWKPDPSALFVNAFTINWHNYFRWIFPTFSQIMQVLKKMREDKAKAIMIVPVWKTQPWWPQIQQLMINHPVQLPQQNLLTLPYKPDQIHPLFPKLKMMACLLSGNDLDNKVSQSVLKKLL